MQQIDHFIHHVDPLTFIYFVFGFTEQNSSTQNHSIHLSFFLFFLSLINSGFKQLDQTSDRSIQQGLVNGTSLSVCLTS